MSISRTDSSPEVQRSGAAGILLGYESSCFNHARYDGYARLSEVQHYPSGLNRAADPCQQVNYYYDGNNPL